MKTFLLMLAGSVSMAAESPKRCAFEYEQSKILLEAEYSQAESCYKMKATIDQKVREFSCHSTESGEMSQKEIQASRETRWLLQEAGFNPDGVTRLVYHEAKLDDDGGAWVLMDVYEGPGKDKDIPHRKAIIAFMGGVLAFDCAP